MDLEVGVGVACDLGYPCAKFHLPRPFGFRVRPDVRDIGQTDDRRRSSLNAPPPLRGGGIVRVCNRHLCSEETCKPRVHAFMHGEKTLYGFSVFSSAADRDCYVEAGTPTILFRASSGECSITAIVSIRIMQHSSVRKWHTFVTNTCTSK